MRSPTRTFDEGLKRRVDACLRSSSFTVSKGASYQILKSCPMRDDPESGEWQGDTGMLKSLVFSTHDIHPAAFSRLVRIAPPFTR